MATHGQGSEPGVSDNWVLDADRAPSRRRFFARRREGGPPGRRRKVWIWIVALIGLPLVLGVATFGALYARTRVPDLPPLAEDTVLFDRRGKPLATLAGEEDREIIAFRKMPRSLRQAVIATEDAEFYDHPGVDVSSTVRAALANIRSGELEQGGSTITQQLVKNLYTGADRTISRKVDEALIAIKLEQQLSKDEILQKYLNTVYFGQGAYGVQAAARTYFDRDAKQLTVQQSAALAGLLAAPTHWDPLEHPEQAAERRSFVLHRMADEGYLSPLRARSLARKDLQVVERQDSWTDGGSAYFVEHTRRWLEDRYGSERTYAGGLEVTTTLDTEWQRVAEQAVDQQLSARSGPQAALVAIDPATGEIRAMVGGRDFDRTKFNLASQAARQPGSAFKTFGLVAAIEAGISPLERFAGPPSIQIRDEPCSSSGDPWEVENYADASAGTTDLFGATANSVNTIFAQVVARTGPTAVAQVAERMGIRSPLDEVCPIVLGSEEVTPLEMTSAYATLAANGVHRTPTPVHEVATREGGVESGASEGTQAVGEAEAAVVTHALEGVVTSGTGTAASLEDRPVAGKTGTAQEYTNAWFCGYVPQLAACVWVGYPEGNRPMDGVTGGSIPAEIWHTFMTEATRGMEVVAFPKVDLSIFRPEPSSTPADRGASDASPSPTTTVVPSPDATPTQPAQPSPTPTDDGDDPGGGGGPGGSPSPSPTATVTPEAADA
ncbi:MAG: PBP1A family penicillin-binding protein [Actinomycetota bacterium]